MKGMVPIGLSLVVLTGALLGARGAEWRTDINPALLYYRAFLVTPEPMSEADRNHLRSKKGREQKLPERFGQIVAGYDNQFFLIRQAAQAKVPCDWGLDLSVGPNAMLPYLGRAKVACQVAQLRAVWALQQGRQADARDELLAAFVLGRNTGTDDILIGTYVQFVIESLDYATVAQYFGDFSAQTLKELVEGFDAAPARRLIAACLPNEKLCYEWLLNKVLELQKAHPHDDAQVMSGIHDCGFVDGMNVIGHTNFWPQLLAASGGTSAGVLKLLRELEPLYPRLGELLALPQSEYESRANQFSQEIQQSQNPFFTGLKSMFTGWVMGSQRLQFRATEFRVQAQLAMVRAAVEYKLNGEAGLKGVKDPFGNGPFSFRRFVFKGVDRGFELKSAYTGTEGPFLMIFVEKKGPAFEVIGPEAGKAIDK
jgi:hypothetical protein